MSIRLSHDTKVHLNAHSEPIDKAHLASVAVLDHAALALLVIDHFADVFDHEVVIADGFVRYEAKARAGNVLDAQGSARDNDNITTKSNMNLSERPTGRHRIRH